MCPYGLVTGDQSFQILYTAFININHQNKKKLLQNRQKAHLLNPIMTFSKRTDFRSRQRHIGPPPAGKFTEAQLNAGFTTEVGNDKLQAAFGGARLVHYQSDSGGRQN